MKNIFTILLFCLPVFSFAQAGKDTTAYREVKGKTNGYSMKLPEYLTETGDLNDDASLQYQNIDKEIYIVVIDESKEEFIRIFTERNKYDTKRSPLANYTKTQLNFFVDAAEKMYYATDLTPTKINKLKANLAEMEAKVEGVESKIYYMFAFIEGEKTMYWIMAWTFPENKEKVKPEFNKMIRSFKEIKQ
jgi:hypothetical protein